ncbi:YncE family protein [Nocardioides alcanivorans]|uniref:YncE family protein n=1 Tax=Nocardioides alcanivorans TaxID=2897352 RepID=UPI001F4835F8|nr:hypothetical protein [Nocardioides alcanivorans]
MRTTKRRTRPRRLAAIAVAGALTATALATSPAQAAEVTVGDRVFDVTSAQAGKSLYQAAWSEEQDAIWVTGTTHHFNLGYPIADESTIQKIDPETLQVEQTITPRTLGAGTDVERPEAAYGVAVDDEHNLVWTSATREDAVVVYDATTGDRVKTIGGVGHSRDIAIDPYRDIAYVSDPNGGSITKISTDTLQVVETIALGGNFSP